MQDPKVVLVEDVVVEEVAPETKEIKVRCSAKPCFHGSPTSLSTIQTTFSFIWPNVMNSSIRINLQVETAPLDPRFPATNQSHHCFVKYNEAHKCFKEKGEDNAECKRLAHAYRSICPSQWIEEWSALREEGKWFGKY